MENLTWEEKLTIIIALDQVAYIESQAGRMVDADRFRDLKWKLWGEMNDKKEAA